MVKQRNLSTTTVRVREGEGAYVTTVNHGKSADGTEMTFGLDIGTAPVPDRKYVTNQVYVASNDEEICLLFGQKRRDGNGLRSLLELHLSPDGLKNFAKIFTQVISNLKAALAVQKLIPLPLVPITEDAPQTVALSANFIAIGFANNEACLDCYMASSFSLDRMRHDGKLALEPVVRINISSRLLIGLLERVVEIENEYAERNMKEGNHVPE